LCFVIVKVMPVDVGFLKASDPIQRRRHLAGDADERIESIIAVAMPVTRLVAPGPEVATATPTLPLARA
jgi:hypothetical protein